MSHWSEETACSVLSELAESANITDVARRRGWAPKLIFTWMHQSQQHENDGKTDSKYLIAWPLDDLGQGEVRFFHRAVQVALRMFASTIDLEHRSNIRGYKKPLLDPRTNMPIYEVDDVLIAKYGGFDE